MTSEKYSQMIIDSVEKNTRAQSFSRDWYLHRRTRVTSTVCHSFKTRAKDIDEEPGRMAWEAFLVLFRAWAPFRPQPWKKGRKREPKAIALYMSLLTADGHCPVLENRGVVIWKDFPVMGCSPDGVMSFDWECCTEKLVLLEVKCPTNLKNSFSGCRPKPLYMTQVQVAMGILNISSCDFFVYRSLTEWRQVTVEFDPKYFNTCVRSVQKLYSEYLSFPSKRLAIYGPTFHCLSILMLNIT